jgi:squalene-associated FAD-dependent desaturase
MIEGRVAVVGGGWAGLAAAVTLAAAGRTVTIFEAAPALGGRARRVALPEHVVDNGQHILLGAYRQTLALLRTVHRERTERDLVERRRLHLERPGVFRLHAPLLPAPWHLLTALLTMQGVSRQDRLATVAFVRHQRRARFRCPAELTVAALLADQPADVVEQLWEPLCVAALNTPLEKASAQVFLSTLREVFAANARDSDLLLPRVDLGALFPDAAARFVTGHGGEIRLARTVIEIAPTTEGVAVTSGPAQELFAAAVIAVGPHQLGALVGNLAAEPRVARVTARVGAFAYEPIVTAYLLYPRALTLVQPMLKLDSDPGQWIFDRGQLGGPAGLAAVVISTDVPAAHGDHARLAEAIDAQLRRLIGDLPAPVWAQVIAERRATYACVAGLERPAAGLLAPHLYLAGDYTDQDFPATLEGATRSGVAAARQLLAAALASH